MSEIVTDFLSLTAAAIALAIFWTAFHVALCPKKSQKGPTHDR